MKSICSYQKSRTRKAAGKLRFKSSNKDSQGVIFLGSELVTDLSDIKAGCCDGSALTYGFTTHAPYDAMFVAHRIGNRFKRAAVLYTNTHMEGI